MVRGRERCEEGVADSMEPENGFTSKRIIQDVVMSKGIICGNQGGMFVVDDGDEQRVEGRWG